MDVEIRRVEGTGAVFENVHPPLIERLANAHVVRDEIDDLPHAVRMQIRDPGIVLLARTDRGVQLVVIGDVVTMQAFRARLEIGRRIAITDTERIQIRHNFPRPRKGELPVKLQPVGRGGNTRMLRCHAEQSFLVIPSGAQRSRGIFRCSASSRRSDSERFLDCARNDKGYIFSGTAMPSRSKPR